jgi:hypothetical protein
MKTPFEPVFPSELAKDVHAGLTAREYIATAAPQGLLSNPNHDIHLAPTTAVKVADELIVALMHTTPPASPEPHAGITSR